MNRQFVERHLLDLEVVTALAVISGARFYFAFSWFASVLMGLPAFILIPLLFLGWFRAKAILFPRRFRD